MPVWIQIIRKKLPLKALFFCFWVAIAISASLPAHAAVIGPDKVSSNSSEGNVAVTVDLQASTPVARDTLVTYTVSGTANNLDHDLTNGSIYILNGTSTASINFNLLDDNDYEGDETIIVTITSVGMGSTIAAQDAHTMTISDDEAVPSLSLTPLDAAESNGSTQMQVITATASAYDITFNYSTTDGTAAAGTHYTSSSSSGTITAGSLSETISIPVIDDSNDNSDRTFTFNISSATLSNGTVATISESSDTATIIDDDLDISINDITVSENTGTATVTVTVANGPSLSSYVDVDYTTVNGTATAGSDFTATSGTVRITSSDAGPIYFTSSETNTITVTIADDSVYESSENLDVTLSNIQNATGSFSDSSGRITITDNDSAPTVDFNATSSSGAESTSSAALQVDLSTSSSSNVTVDYAVTGTATGTGTDYTLANGTLTITAGNTTGTITIASIVDDALVEGNETVIVTLSNPSGATLGTDTVHTYTITDNDSAPTVDFNATSSSGAESTSSAALQVDLSTSSSSNVTVDYAVTGTATGTGTDYTLANGTLTITAGNTTGTITIASIVDDALVEGNETVIVTLSNPSGATLGTDTVHTYTITDNDGTSSSTVSDAEMNSATDQVNELWRANDRLYNERVTDQSRQILQLSLNDTLGGDCAVSGHVLCGATIKIAKAKKQVGKPDILVQGGDDGIVGNASFVDVQKLVGDGSKRIVSVATEYVDHKGDTSTHSVMASYAREYFDDSMQASLGVMSHLYKAKTDVQGAYRGDAITEGVNIGMYTNYFGNMDYVMGLYGSVGFSETHYDLASSSTSVNNDFDAWNLQAGFNVMGKRQYKNVLFMPKFTIDTFITKQKDSMPRVTVGSATRYGFVASRVLSEVQLGFRPHFKIAEVRTNGADISQADLVKELDVNPQIFCGYAANESDCGLALGITNKWKPMDGDTEYRLGTDFSEYRNERKARIEFNMETQHFDNPNMTSSTTIANDNVAMGTDHAVDDIGVKWHFDYKF